MKLRDAIDKLVGRLRTRRRKPQTDTEKDRELEQLVQSGSAGNTFPQR
jgi:hypothetical protein